MSDNKNPWDKLASHFAPEDPDKLEWDAVDNILIAQPVILDFLGESFAKPYGLNLLEFGCGGGQFADRLQKLGYSVDGIDTSPHMIAAARTQYGRNGDFRVGRAISLDDKEYDVITSVMTLQFIPDIENTVLNLSKALKPSGLLVFAVHNPAFVSDWIKAKYRYIGFDSEEHPTKGLLQFGREVEIPIYIRSATEYSDIAEKSHLQALLESYPPFTEEFLKKYPVDGPTQNSEFMILGYKKRPQ